jgi:NAD(P)-dependent dehydrogenase (short-subunit alcohol dehydrogenase family)
MADALRDFRVEGKVAIVTGAARGIGLGVAELLAEAGAGVVAADVIAGGHEQLAASAAHQASLAEMKERSPLGVPGEPHDIAIAVVYLASDASRYTTGQVLHPNGGALMVS